MASRGASHRGSIDCLDASGNSLLHQVQELHKAVLACAVLARPGSLDDGACVAPVVSMPLLPRWRYMTDDAKALVRRGAVSGLIVALVLLVFRSLLPWVLLALVGWWIWRALRR